MKKNISISLFSGIVAMFCFACFANAQGVALPTNVGLPGGDLTSIVSNFTNWLLAIFGFLAIISFLVSGMMYFFSAGDDTAQEKAKKQMTWSILGVVIGLIGLVVVYTVDMFLNGGSASFGTGSTPTSSQSSSWSSTSPTAPTNTTEWLGTGSNPKTGNRVFIDQQGRKFELINGSLTPMNDAGTTTNSGPDSSYQP
ncbi:MAG: pilin [Parcubacteria group bacterium]|jgi:hypothetical protein